MQYTNMLFQLAVYLRQMEAGVMSEWAWIFEGIERLEAPGDHPKNKNKKIAVIVKKYFQVQLTLRSQELRIIFFRKGNIIVLCDCTHPSSYYVVSSIANLKKEKTTQARGNDHKQILLLSIHSWRKYSKHRLSMLYSPSEFVSFVLSCCNNIMPKIASIMFP